MALAAPLLMVVVASLAAEGSTVVEGRQEAGERAERAGIALRAREGASGLAGQVLDAETERPLPARVVVRDARGTVVATRYEHLPGIFTDEDGTFSVDLAPGAYALEVHHGLDFVSQRHDFEVTERAGVEARVRLEPWVRLRELGWVNGDGHAHLYTDQKHDDPMLRTVRRICRAQGVDFLAACQGWGGYGDDDWREGYAALSDERFLLHYGAEMPKHRTGHTFWLGLESTRGYHAESMDRTYEDEYYQVARNPQWSFETLPFPSIPDTELVPRLREAEDALALVPHPTSWWWQERDGLEKYTTNVAAHLAFGLLAGGLWDGLVVMGYDHDHYFYQNLWFHILNEGYRMAPVAELDGGLEPGTRFYYGAMRTYAHVGAERGMAGVVAAVRAGRTFVTSGPIILARLDDGHVVGDVVPADGKARTLRIQAFASGDPEDHLDYLILFRNGRIHRLWDRRDERPRRLEVELELRESESAWYVLKAYGRSNDRSPESLDVMRVCDDIAAGRPAPALAPGSDVALTSPFYFRPEGAGDPPPLRSRVRLTVVDPETRAPVGKGTVRVRLLGRTIGTHELRAGRAELSMPVNAVLGVDVPGRATVRRSLYLDYPPHRDLLERLASGRWLAGYGGRERLQPGQVPWEAFHLDEARRVLSDVDWTIAAKPNERDGLWRRFEALFDREGRGRRTGRNGQGGDEEEEPASAFEVRETAQGVEVRDSGDLVLFYQRELKDHEGRYARSNYVHPLMSLDGVALTEDFPEDHLHQRGIFWAWHQIWDGEERLGDGWALEDFVTEVTRVESRVADGVARLEAEVGWRSPRFREGREPFVDERTTITVHPVVGEARAIDFAIALRARSAGVRIGGSEDPKGYGGFSVRVAMPDGLVFTGEGGPVTPKELQVEAGPWVDVSAPYGPEGAVSGVAILTHPDSPGFPQPWILRQKASMQNPVFPGREAVRVPTGGPLVLRYRLVVHRGVAHGEDIGRWQEEYARQQAPARP